MARGLPKKYAKMGFKKGWREYKKTQRGRSTKARKRRGNPSSTRKKGKRVARNRKIPLFATAGFVVPFVSPLPTGRNILGDVMAGDLDSLGYDLKEFIGIEAPTGKFRLDYLGRTLTPIVVGVLVSKLLSKLGANRYLSSVPFVKL